jgi:hypothetical protein
MSAPVTVLAPIKLAAGKTEDDLLKASHLFEKNFASGQPGILRRELVKKGEGEYIDIVQFRSSQDMEEVIAKEQESEACHAFFAVMDIDMEEADDSQIEVYQSLATYD